MQTKTNNPDPVDLHVGSRVKLRRTLLGMSQTALASELGLTFQQIQKYERGINRMGSSRLHQISVILKVTVSFFFEDIDVSASQSDESSNALRAEINSLSKRETLELVKSYYKISDPKVKQKIFELIKVVGHSSFSRAESQ